MFISRAQTITFGALFKTFPLMFVMLSLVVVSCTSEVDEVQKGDTTEGDAIEETSSPVTEKGSSNEVTDNAGDLQEDLYNILIDINSVEDAKAADENIGEIFNKRALLMRSTSSDPSEALAMQDDPKFIEFEQKVNEQMDAIVSQDPRVGIEVTEIMLKHGKKLIDALTETHREQNLDKAFNELGKELQETKEKIEKLKGE